MSFIKKIELPDNNTYDIKNTIIPVVGTQNIATNTWIGNIDVPSLYDGLTIIYHLPYTSEGEVTLNLTLSSGVTTGEIKVYLDKNRLSGQLDEGIDITLTYQSAGSISIDGVSTIDDRWIAQIDTLYDFKAGNEIGYFKVKDSRGKEIEISPYYGYGEDNGDLPLIIDSVEGEVDEITINGNDEPNRIDTIEGTLPITPNATAGAALDWRIDGNNVPQVESTTEVLPLTFPSNGDNVTDYTIYGNNNPCEPEQTSVLPITFETVEDKLRDWSISGNDDNGTENFFQTTATSSSGGGFIFAVNNDGSITVTGTPTLSTTYFFVLGQISVPAGTYTITGCPNGGSWGGSNPQTYCTSVQVAGVGTLYETGDGVTVTAQSETTIKLIITLSTSLSNIDLTYKPMVVKGSTTPDHYIPYQKGVGERTKNVCTAPTAQTKTDGALSVTTDGQGRYNISISSTISTQTEVSFDLPEFTIPISVGKGGNGTFSMFNTVKSGVYIYFYYNDTKIDYWHLNATNKQSNSYTNMGNKQCNKIVFSTDGTVYAGTAECAIMFTNDSILPTSYAPYGYKVPLTVSQQGQTDKTYDIYIGDTPLRAGQSISKTSTGVDIETQVGENTISTTLYNKPVMYCGKALGVGIPTENLFNYTTIPLTETEFALAVDGGTIYIKELNTWGISEYIPVTEGVYTAVGLSNGGSNTACCVYDSNKQYISGVAIVANQNTTINVPSNGSFIRLSVRYVEDEYLTAMLVKGSTAPTTYIPYGYKVPITITDENSNTTEQTFYIGNSRLLSGDTYTKTQAGIDIPTTSGNNTISTTLYNKPQMNVVCNSNVLGVGRRTENLFDKTTATQYRMINSSTGEIESSFSTRYATDWIDIEQSDTISISNTAVESGAFYDSSKQYISGIYSYGANKSVPSGAQYVRLTVIRDDLDYFMLVNGSTAPETYIPFGYQISISVTSGQTTTPYNYYIGNTPLTAGQSISKTSTGTDISLLSGTNTISTTLGNKPEMRVKYESAEVGVGIKTENLFDISKIVGDAITVDGYTFTKGSTGYWYDIFSHTAGYGAALRTDKAIKLNAGTYTLSAINITPATIKWNVRYADLNGQNQSDVVSNKTLPQTFTLANAGYVSFRIDQGTPIVDRLMLVKGSTAPNHYIPYGYKVPIRIYNKDRIRDDIPQFQKDLVNAVPHQTQVTLQKGQTSILFDVIGVDHDTCYYPDGRKAKHSVTVQSHDCVASLQFCARQALFTFPHGCPIGTYHFKVVNQPWYASDVGKSMQFTLTKAIPEGGQLVINNAYNATMIGATISSYNSPSTITALESVTMSQGTGGTNLGDVANATNGNTNSVQRALVGSNNYQYSAIRQWLNSNSVAGSVWTPQTPFDRPPAWFSNTAGFLNGIDADIQALIGECDKITALNTITDGGDSWTSREKVFLLSRSEVYGGNEVTGGEGAVYPYYSDYSDLSTAGTGNDTNRIKYSGGSAQYWSLRSPNAGNAYIVRRIGPSGDVNYNGTAANPHGVAPAFVIPMDDIYEYEDTIIYLGNSLLTQGESVTKTKEELNINTYFGENIIDSAVYNPPSISIKHPQEIEPYLNNYINQKISIYNTETIIPQFLERKEIDNHLADTIGTKGSINLFPIDKGVLGDPFVYSQTEGEFYIMQGDSSRDNISSIAFIGLTNSTSETTVTYKAFFNYNYQYPDHSFLFGDLLPGDYVLDYETLEDDFSDVGEIYYEVYEALDSSGGGDLIASGQSVEFTVTKEKPYIMIEIIAKRNSGYNWEDAYLWFIPFLRRKYFENEDVDSYIPSIKKLSDPKSYWLSAPTDSGIVTADSSTGKLKTNNGIIFDGNNYILKIGNNNNYGSIQLQAGSSLLYNTITAGACVQPVTHTLPSTTGTLINNTDYNNSEITIYTSHNNDMTSDNNIPLYNVTNIRDKIKYIDIYFTDNNYYKGFSGGMNIVSENYGYLRIPYDEISKDPINYSTRFSLFLVGDQDTFYLRKRTYYIYEVESLEDPEDENSDMKYQLGLRPSLNNKDLILKFEGTPGTSPDWNTMTLKGMYSPSIKIYMIKLVLEL